MPGIKQFSMQKNTEKSKKTPLPFRSYSNFLPTLFDRLRDADPQQLQEAPDDVALTRKQMVDIVRRDLSYLLNTSNMDALIDRQQHAEAAASTINFGMPSLAGGYLTTRRWVDIERLVRLAITDFEPRLITDSLDIQPLRKDQSAGQYNVLLFEIRGLIQMDPYPLAFLVQSAVDLETNRLSVMPCS